MKGNNLSHWGEINKPFDALTMEKQKKKKKTDKQDNKINNNNNNNNMNTIE